jgi:hypothetical protein
MDADQIEERLLYELRGARHDDVFSGASAVDLVFHIRRASKTMVAEGRTSEADLTESFESLRAFVAEMDTQRTQLGLTEFHEITVSQADAQLCPGFWPFC